MNVEIKSGWFLSFSPEEKETERDLIYLLEENGFDATPEGLKKFLCSIIYCEPPPGKSEKQNKTSPIMDAIKDNPEAVIKTFETIGSLIKKGVNAKVFKTRK